MTDAVLFLMNTNGSWILDNVFYGGDLMYVNAMAILNKTKNNEVKRNKFVGPNANYGLYGYMTYGTVVEDNEAYNLMNGDYKTAIQFQDSSQVEIRNNTIYSVVFGIWFVRGPGSGSF